MTAKKRYKRRINHGVIQPTFTNRGVQQTFRQLCELALKDTPPQYREGLFVGLLDLMRQIGENTFCEPAGASLNAVATALAVSREMTPMFRISSLNNKLLAFHREAAALAISAEGVLPDSYLAANGTENQRDEVFLNWWSQLIRNSLYQGDTLARITNALVLTGLRGFCGLPKDSELIESLFNKYLNVRAEDYFVVLFALWSQSLTEVLTHGDIFFKNSTSEDPLNIVFEAVTRDLSKPISDSIYNIEKMRTFSGHSLAEAFFARWPLIQVGEQSFAFAGHHFLEVQLIYKFLAKALALARQDEKNSRTKFSQFMAKRFEDFVCELLKLTNINFEPEHRYERGQEKKSADFTLFEKHGSNSVVTLMQLKLKMFQEVSFYGASMESLLKDVEKDFARSITQTIRYLRHLNSAADNNRLEQESEVISRRIMRAEKIMIVCVTPEFPAMFTSWPLRNRLLEAIKIELGDDWEWFNEKYNGRWEWHVIGLNELETFISLPRAKHDFHKQLYVYLRDSGIDRQQFDNGYRLPKDFRNFLITRHQRFDKETQTKRIVPIPQLKETFDSFANDVIAMMAFKTTELVLPD